jgi:diguanylate cyclase (GGDEF)-like protein
VGTLEADHFMARLAVLERASMALLQGVLDEDWRRQAEWEAHKLAGSVGIFGFIEGTRLAREVHGMLAAKGRLDYAQARPFAEMVATLHKELERDPSGHGAEPVPGEENIRVLVVEDSSEVAERLALEATLRGMSAQVVASLADARIALELHRPDVVLLDLSLSDAEEDGLNLLSELSAQIPPVPVIVHTARGSLLDRVEVARLGGSAYLEKPVLPAQVMDTVSQVLKRRPSVEARVMAVDDDPVVLDGLRCVLESAGLELTMLDDPTRFWEVLEGLSPDLLLLDVDMPGLNGIELCRVVRNDPRWRDLPVLFLTAHTNTDTVQRVFAAGADDFVGKPIVASELLTRITNRLERDRLQRSLVGMDTLTGLANRHRSGPLLNNYLRLCSRYQQPFSLAVLELDDFEQVKDQHGRAAADVVLRLVGQLLSRSFRSEDVVVRWGDHEFVIGMYTMLKERGTERFERVLEVLRREQFSGPGGALFQVTYSAGIAQYPIDGSDLLTLHRAAGRALQLARGAGCNRVLPAGSRPARSDSTQSVDVALVADDEGLAAQLLKALEIRGYRSVWLRNGEAAAEALGGLSPAVEARVALMDMGLRDLDGLSVLKRLSRQRVLDETKIIMLATESSDTTAQSALELGAHEYVARPFTVPELMQRLRRAMAA